MKTLRIFTLCLFFLSIMGFSSLLSNGKEEKVKETPLILELKTDDINIDEFNSNLNKAEKSLYDRHILISSLEAKIKGKEFIELDSIVIR